MHDLTHPYAHMHTQKQMQELSRSLRAERDDKERLSQEIAALKTRLGAATDELAAARQQLARAGEEGGEQRCVKGFVCCFGVGGCFASSGRQRL